MRVFYLPLEAYEERYTLQLRDWTMARFAQRQIEVVEVLGDPLLSDGQIHTGIVLDAHGRSYWSLTQMARLVALMRQGEVTADDVVYAQDLFHPGWEALPYICDQLPVHLRPRVYTHLLAQTIDPNDFTFGMRHWMRHYELMLDKTLTGVFLASTVMVDMMRAALFDAPLHVVGLPFDKHEVRQRAGDVTPLEQRSRRVLFSSRWDKEKQPWFYMDMIEHIYTRYPEWAETVEFALATGSPELRSNAPEYVHRANQLADRGLLTIYSGLKKADYYRLLKDSRVQFNCALQDFVSNTLNEASALGTPSLLPAYLSFPEAVFNDRRRLYVPWSIEDAAQQLITVIEQPEIYAVDVERAADYQHDTLDRVIDVLIG